MPPELPADVLREIFRYCDPNDITTTCRSFASIAYTIPSLWSVVHLRPCHLASEHGPELLSRRLERAREAPLSVSLAPFNSEALFEDFCKTLFKFNKRIKRLELTIETSDLAGIALSCIFYGGLPDEHPPSTFPGLKMLSVQVTEDAPEFPGSPVLADFLRFAMEKDLFPALQSLAIPTFGDCIPYVETSASFAHLCTLAIHGYLEHSSTDIKLVIALLHHTPQLETFWFKHVTKHYFSSSPQTHSQMIILPRLTHLSVTAPGCALDILLKMDAPALRDLHIDFSGGPAKGLDKRYHSRAIQNSLSHLSVCSKGLRRLALTSTYLTRRNWDWLLFGGEGIPPFPQMESVALHRVEETPETEFNDGLLQQYAEQPILPLRRLALPRCSFPLSGSVVAKAFESAINAGTSNGPYEFEFGPSCPQWAEEDFQVLEAIGVKLIRREEGEVKEDKWWTRGHRIDPFDSHAY